MRLKVEPGDFVVREDLSFRSVPHGDYYVHVLRKEKLDTHQALAEVAKLADVGREDIAFAGLKDRQGRTEQWISIRGRRLDHRGKGLSVHYRGRSDEPVSSQQSRGNHFEIVVRDLSHADVDTITAAATRLQVEGMPNYFDDQRFGCLRHGQGFVLRSALHGNWEAALHQMIARPSEVAITGDIKLKRLIAERWGDWDACLALARGPVYRPVFEILRDRPTAYREALAALPTRTKLIHAFAFQSYLWNRAVDRVLFGLLPPPARLKLPTLVGNLVAWNAPYRHVYNKIKALRTPLFGPDGDPGDPDFARAAESVLAEQGIDEEQCRRNTVPGMVLRSEPRALVIRPRDLEVSPGERDEAHPGRGKVRLEFALPRGCYATLVVKRLLARREAPHDRPRNESRYHEA